VIIADTSGLLALFNSSEPTHDRIAQLVAAADGQLVVSPFVIAELDYLVATRPGVAAELAVLAELTSGAYVLAQLEDADLARCGEVVGHYRDQDIGVTDASLVVLADRFGTTRLLTLDRRHFGVVRALDGSPFQLLGA